MNDKNRLYINVENNMQKYCKLKKITLSELARLININENEFHDCRKLSINKLIAICKVLDIELYDLLERREEK